MKKNIITKVEKQALPVIIDTNTGEPIALIFFSPQRERIIYTLKKADEDEIVELLTQSTTTKTTPPTNPQADI